MFYCLMKIVSTPFKIFQVNEKRCICIRSIVMMEIDSYPYKMLKKSQFIFELRLMSINLFYSISFYKDLGLLMR